MGNSRTGNSLVILGIVLCLFGLMLALHQTQLIEHVTNMFPSIQLAELVGILLQLLGVTLSVAGFNALISEIIERYFENEMGKWRNEITFKIERALSELKNVSPEIIKSAAKSCKFCGAPLDEEEFFCRTCGKAQK